MEAAVSADRWSTAGGADSVVSRSVGRARVVSGVDRVARDGNPRRCGGAGSRTQHQHKQDKRETSEDSCRCPNLITDRNSGEEAKESHRQQCLGRVALPASESNELRTPTVLFYKHLYASCCKYPIANFQIPTVIRIPAANYITGTQKQTVKIAQTLVG
jgi:hypothetical protein